MFLKRTRVRSGGRQYAYAQVVESYWDNGKPRHRVLLSLGRIDQVDPEMIVRLAKSLAQLAPGVTVVEGPEDVHAQGAKSCGHTWALTQLWEELGLGRCLRELVQGRRIRFDLEAAVRAMVLGRLSCPGSERKVLAWREGVELAGSETLRLQHLYRTLKRDGAAGAGACRGVRACLRDAAGGGAAGRESGPADERAGGAAHNPAAPGGAPGGKLLTWRTLKRRYGQHRGPRPSANCQSRV